MKQLGVDEIAQFRTKWVDSPISKYKKQERLKGFFHFSVARRAMVRHARACLIAPRNGEALILTAVGFARSAATTSCGMHDSVGLKAGTAPAARVFSVPTTFPRRMHTTAVEPLLGEAIRLSGGRLRRGGFFATVC